MTDHPEVNPPCAKCRHATTCDLPPTCHALRFFEATGKRITPPLVFPGGRREEQPAPAPKPRTTQRDSRGMTDSEREALEQFERDMQEARKE